MDVNIIFKIGAIGILVAALYMVLKSTGREELALMAALGGLVVVLMMVIQMISELFENVRTMFHLY
ncbi:MAG: stage III sporulation protein AC [Bacillota bacterium]|nr:stage III sporulation protein AC [Bacillota bacterium]MDD3298928.1 stage III sporulation protein AC [Bacillota bacterium]MDD3850522.1 stage III sporulation protein AC [Bacillota bacterium]MDD4707652.1 stage III sporulation protein AC [Bacillota bacterium]